MKKKVKHSNSKHRIRWTDENGIRQSRYITDKSEANLTLKREKLRVQEVKHGISPHLASKKSFDELIDYWIEVKTPEKRSIKDDISVINCHLKPYFSNLSLRKISLLRINNFKSEETTSGLTYCLVKPSIGKEAKRQFIKNTVGKFLFW